MTMPVTHGIVNSKAPAAATAFRLEWTALATAEDMSVDLYGPISSEVDIDYGDGAIVTITLDVSPKTVVGASLGLDLVATSDTLERWVFRTSSRPRVINLINGTSLTSLISFVGSNAVPSTVNIRNAPNALNWTGICFNLPNLATFTVDDSSMVTSMVNGFNGNNLTEIPTTISFASVLDLQQSFKGSKSMVTAGTITAPVCTNFIDVISDSQNMESLTLITPLGELFDRALDNCLALICLGAIDTTNQTSTTDLFLNTPALTNPTASEQTAILAGDNYVNAGACG